MNESSPNQEKISLTAYVIGILGAFLIMAALVGALRHYTTPAPAGQGRAEERRKNLKELRAEETTLLTQYDWQDKAKDIVRLPIQRAMELTLQEWQNPAAARSNLIARALKAAAPAPKAPEKPNPFE